MEQMTYSPKLIKRSFNLPSKSVFIINLYASFPSLTLKETANFHGRREEPSFDLMKIEIQWRVSLNIPGTFNWKWQVGSLGRATVVAHVMFPCLQIRDLIIVDYQKDGNKSKHLPLFFFVAKLCLKKEALRLSLVKSVQTYFSSSRQLAERISKVFPRSFRTNSCSEVKCTSLWVVTYTLYCMAANMNGMKKVIQGEKLFIQQSYNSGIEATVINKRKQFTYVHKEHNMRFPFVKWCNVLQRLFSVKERHQNWFWNI